LYICRGLFEKDKFVYAFMMAAKINIEAGNVSPTEWQMYMIGAGPPPRPAEAIAPPAAQAASWLTEINGVLSIWDELCSLEQQLGGTVTGLCRSIKEHYEEWRQAFMETEQPHLSPLPGEWDEKVPNFQKLLLLRVLRPEKVVFGTRVYVGRSLGQSFTASPPFDLSGTFLDSDNQTPLIFVLSAGADPNDYLMKLATDLDKVGGLRIISLGQGQGPIAEAAVVQARMGGDWVCLQNCHLAVSWLGRMERLIEETMEMEGVHAEYRLWLTSMPSAVFPVPVLQNGIKITNEPPKGLKANLSRTFLDMTEDTYEGCTKPREYKKLLYGLAFYNAVSLERRKYGALGWNIRYMWMNSDFNTGVMQVKAYLEEQPEVPFETLNVCVAEISYGGRVTDKMDKITNVTIMRKYFVPEILEDS
jgi:dynein heavy chain